MSTFISALRNGAKLLERRDDDSFDRLSNRYSVGVVIMMAAFISTKNYIGDPISCWHPFEFSIQMRKYVDNICWVSNTYYVPFDQPLVPTIPPGGSSAETPVYAQELTYYQWVPIVLTFCALMFAVPAQIWAWVSNSYGYDVEAIVKTTQGAANINPEVRDKTIQYLVNQMGRLLGYRRPVRTKGRFANYRQSSKALRVGKRFGHFLFLLYMLVKVLYIANAVTLLFILNTMLGSGYHYYGLDVLHELQDPDYKGSERFPYVTMCDFWVRHMGKNIHKYTVQCVLPVNLFNEKVFIALWFWLVFVAGASIFGLILWIFTAALSVNKLFARKYLTIMGRVNKSDSDELISEFVTDYLRLDGVFCMRLIIKNTNDAIGGEIMAALWDQFIQRRKPKFEEPTIRHSESLPSRLGEDSV